MPESPLPNHSTSMATEKSEMEPASNDVKLGGEAEEQSIIFIDPEIEKRTVRKFDYLVLPQFVTIIVLGYGTSYCSFFFGGRFQTNA